MFFQANEPPNGVKTGLGVGLAVAKVLAELHGGTIAAYSAGKGTGVEFTVLLPLIFDLDGTLIDSVYTHVLAWQKSFAAAGLQVPAWSIHKKIGLGGQELAQAIGREPGKPVSEDEAQEMDQRHSAIMKELSAVSEPLPGAAALLGYEARCALWQTRCLRR
jgi:hypothetical protein